MEENNFNQQMRNIVIGKIKGKIEPKYWNIFIENVSFPNDPIGPVMIPDVTIQFKEEFENFKRVIQQAEQEFRLSLHK